MSESWTFLSGLDCPSYKATPDFVSMVKNFNPNQSRIAQATKLHHILWAWSKISIQINPRLPKLQSYTWFCEHGHIFTPIQDYFKPELQSYITFCLSTIKISSQDHFKLKLQIYIRFSNFHSNPRLFQACSLSYEATSNSVWVLKS